MDHSEGQSKGKKRHRSDEAGLQGPAGDTTTAALDPPTEASDPDPAAGVDAQRIPCKHSMQPAKPTASHPSDAFPGCSPQPSKLRPPKPGAVMLVLVGVQGSGKSTFSQKLIEGAAAGSCKWVRVNQDSVNNGRRGTREMCLAAARSALTSGRSAIIDRTNIDASQRKPFLTLARESLAQPHCLVLRLPVKTCMARAAGREHHEGGLKGKGVYAAVNIMHSAYMKAGPPTLEEGFQSVLVCESDAEVEAALQAWSIFGTVHCDPLEAWRKLAPPRRDPLPGDAPPVRSQKGGSRGAKAVTPGGRGSIESYFRKFPSSQQGAAAGSEPGGSEGRSGLREPLSQHQPAQQQREQQPLSLRSAPARQEQPAEQARQGAASQPSSPQQESAKRPSSRQRTQQARQGRGSLSDLPVGAGSSGGGGGDARQTLMAHARHAGGQQAQLQQQEQEDAAGRGESQAVTGTPIAGRELAGSRHTFTSRFPGVSALCQVAANPERAAPGDPAFLSDPQCVRISDKYPKAKHHALVIARDPHLQGPLDLGREHLPLVNHMLEVGRGWAQRQGLGRDPSGPSHPPAFFYGFHSVPSMRQLHLHVISQDLDSPCLKTKKHYLSFLPPFFLPAEHVLVELAQAGRLRYSLHDKEALLKREIRCHRCGGRLPNMPSLKQHLDGCLGVAPSQ